MKTILKKIPGIMPFFVFVYKEIIQPIRGLNLGLYTTLRTIKYFKNKNNIYGWKASIRVSCHIIEKGLTMPNKRLGFGNERITFLANEILNKEIFRSTYEYNMAVGLIKEYKDLHQIHGYNLPIKTQQLINSVDELFPEVEKLGQIKTNIRDFFSNHESNFPNFSKSRHSVRNFSGPVTKMQINDSIMLALTAPSACNRQAIRCHVYCEKEDVQNILTLQNGNRGFGELVPQVCVLTVDLRMIGQNEQNDIYFNAGLFAMNLSYAFHYNKVGSCMLNWSVTPHKDRTLKRVANIPKPESPVVIFAFGIPNDSFEVTKSQKKSISEAVVFH